MAKRDPRVNPVPGDQVSNTAGTMTFTVYDRVDLVRPAAKPKPALLVCAASPKSKPRTYYLPQGEFAQLVRRGTVWRVAEGKAAPAAQVKASTKGFPDPADRAAERLDSSFYLARVEAIETLSRGPRAALMARLPALRKLLRDPEDYVARVAADAIGKLGPAAGDDTAADLADVALARKYTSGGCPQRFCHAMGALLKVKPDHPDLVDLCRRALKVSNFGIQKDAIATLMKVRTPESTKVLRNLDLHRNPAIEGKPVDALLARVSAELRRRG